MEIYADVVFAVNFLMDLLILWGAGLFAGRRARWHRLCGGAFVMALLYVLFIVYIPHAAFTAVLASLVLIGLGVWVAFRPRGVGEMGRLVLFSYIFAFALGGLGLALFSATNFGGLPAAAGWVAAGFSLNLLLTSAAVCYIVVKLLHRWYAARVLRRQEVYDVEVFVDGSRQSFKALLDTGHSLSDPISNTPVIIAEFAAVKPLLPDAVRLIFYERREDDVTSVLAGVSGSSFVGRIRLIPFSAVGTHGGMLIGFRTDRVEIRRGEAETTSLRETVVGICNNTLSGKGAYQGLLNPDILNIS
ncbi:MAG: sigma-E processing peptidase SpoIIGA [Defluviitaleaceae bacterium]|nr:sigma-E processing peptidase SpoIIGA [Defluviitaleaceae bacterium]